MQPHAALRVSEEKTEHFPFGGDPGFQDGIGIGDGPTAAGPGAVYRFQTVTCQGADGVNTAEQEAGLGVVVSPEIEQPDTAGIAPPPGGCIPIGDEDFTCGLFPGFARLPGAVAWSCVGGPDHPIVPLAEIEATLSRAGGRNGALCQKLRERLFRMGPFGSGADQDGHRNSSKRALLRMRSPRLPALRRANRARSRAFTGFLDRAQVTSTTTAFGL